MNKFDFENRTAVITGGGQGFGLDIAKRFLDSGAKVIIWDIDEELLKSAVDEVNNSNLSYNVIDVSNYDIFIYFPMDVMKPRNYRLTNPKLSKVTA